MTAYRSRFLEALLVEGVFEILPRDQAPGIQQESQLFKTVRVVATIEYQLRD